MAKNKNAKTPWSEKDHRLSTDLTVKREGTC